MQQADIGVCRASVISITPFLHLLAQFLHPRRQFLHARIGFVWQPAGSGVWNDVRGGREISGDGHEECAL
ncbi:hypothetical protein [Candidatus Spongiihabitans sp.]|uniref:hypothetical protein n=1 Tax=Candidatus Spongiihabitans sp. TaxID=3101308 RepID=UPI003C6FFDC2